MKFLFICGSSVPTLCGVGKYTDKIANMLLKNNHEVVLIGNKNQKLGKKDGTETPYSLIKIDILFKNLFKIFQIIKYERPDVINIQYNSLEFGRLFFPSILSILLKLRFPKIHLQVNIHEFSSYTLLGKIRHIIPTIFADKVFFSDNKQMQSAVNFAHNLISKKSEVLLLGSNINFKNPKYNFKPVDNQETLNILFHGLVQPKNGIEYLLQALCILKKEKINFKLHILGDFKMLADYGNLNIEIKEYQKKWLNYLQENLSDECIIHGDVDPSSDKFRKALEKIEVCVVPDIDGITVRRSSFWNVFMQSQNIMMTSFDNQGSDQIFKKFITFKIKNKQDIAYVLKEYIHLSKQDKIEIYKKQNIVKSEMSVEKIETSIIRQLNK